MYYGESKVYFDGSHYIAIPKTVRPLKKRSKQPEELITIVVDKDEELKMEGSQTEPSISSNNNEILRTRNETEIVETKVENKTKKERKLTRKELFEELYKKYINETKKIRKQIIINEMLPYFKNAKDCELYVELNFERKARNLICRRVRMCRKAYLANFNYFCTFTYDSNKHTEESFKKKLKTCFRHFCERRKWKYMGVWERASKTNRLHFHGLFNIPENAMAGEIIKVKDYDTISHKMQESFQSSYFNERFGRSDFKEISNNDKELGRELAYLMKYIEKTGEKIAYSKGLPQYFISDILEDDIVCRIGQEDRKLLLFDDFMCLDEGELIGKVSLSIIKKMRHCN